MSENAHCEEQGTELARRDAHTNRNQDVLVFRAIDRWHESWRARKPGAASTSERIITNQHLTIKLAGSNSQARVIGQLWGCGAPVSYPARRACTNRAGRETGAPAVEEKVFSTSHGALGTALPTLERTADLANTHEIATAPGSSHYNVLQLQGIAPPSLALWWIEGGECQACTWLVPGFEVASRWLRGGLRVA